MTTVIAAAILSLASPQATRVAMSIEGRGEMLIEVYTEKAPRTASHFLSLVRSSFYDGTRFHRVENTPRPFIVVAGDPLSKSLDLDDPRIGTGGSGTKIPFEKNDLQFTNGTLGLSREKKDLNSGDSQFFICNGNQRFLEGTYTAFGRVVQGLELIPRIQRGDRIVSMRLR
jgi:cyclophilin family peptidyl-prolyl cis-trans isomerase